MVLLDAVLRFRAPMSLHLEVAHLDHALRDGSAQDAAFVAAHCDAHEVTFHGLRVEPPLVRTNLERWGREQRYRWFRTILRERGLSWCLTAHHADDVAETLLMRLLSNKEPRSILPASRRLGVLRPMLSLSRDAIRRYAEEYAVPFREDPSNRTSRFLRNRVRHQLLPTCEEVAGPGVAERLAWRARALDEDDRLLRRYAQSVIADLPQPFGSREWYGALRTRLAQSDRALHWRVAEELLLDPLTYRIGREVGERVAMVLRGERVGVQLPGNLTLRRRAGGLELARGTLAT